MKQNFSIFIIILSLILAGIMQGVLAEESNLTNSTNISVNNLTNGTKDIEYPLNGDELAEGIEYDISAKDYAVAGKISSGFSGSSIEGSESNQSPSVVMSFSDKSSVSGFIHNFMKSFQYESGVDL
ncbi:hypothetical protein ACKUB1_15100 [Methanospirillum stamsii]|uniref:Uncharacterized protein n=1 Tax=Methanospirillum stamsii TaxID=1277351 RepID=A0A2V2N589_9EURY|nr:hypothetical protein [Methanospirillum stamsii]PWR75254.1 hypothetical protein DLD82_05560 [Methanospirillum stamsii]